MWLVWGKGDVHVVWIGKPRIVLLGRLMFRWDEYMKKNVNPLKTKRFCVILELISYRAVNTLHLGYKNQILNAV